MAIIGGRGYVGSTIAEFLRPDSAVLRLTREPAAADDRAFDFWSDDAAGALTDADAVVFVARVHPASEHDATLEQLAARVRRLVDACGARPVVALSTDAVFAGDRGLYREDELPGPVTWYGRCARVIEEVVIEKARSGCVVRPSYVYGIGAAGLDRRFTRALRAVAEDRPFDVYSDMFRSPIEVGDLARVVAGILADGTEGVVHAGGPRISTADFYSAGLAALGAGTRVLQRRTLPAGSVQPDTSLLSRRLASELGLSPRPIEAALAEPAGAR